MNDSTQEPTPEEPKPISTGRALAYSIASIGCGMFNGYNNAGIPLYMEQFTKNHIILGLMGSSHSIEGAVIQPIVGSLSDRTRTKLGRRRPFMLLFFPLSALFMAFTPLAAGLPGPIRVGALVALIFAFTVCFNVAFDPYQALMPDITPQSQRGRVFSLWSLLGVLGQASILLLPVSHETKFVLVAIVMTVTALLTCWLVPEPNRNDKIGKHKSAKDELRQAIQGLRTLREARKGLIVFFLTGFGIGAVLPFLTLFVVKITHCSGQQAQDMFFVLMISTAVTVLPMGRITDKIGAFRVLLISLILIGIASFAAIFATSLLHITLLLVVAGVGNAAQSAAAYPLMTSLVPREEVGLYTGLQTMMLSIAQPLTVVVTGKFLDLGIYRSIFVVCGVCMIAGLLQLRTINLEKGLQEIVTRRRELTDAAS